MPTTQYLLPDSDGGTDLADWHQFPDSGDKHDKVNDESDSTYVYRQNGEPADGNGNGDGLLFGLSTYTLGATERCLRARIAIRYSTNGGTGQTYCYMMMSGGPWGLALYNNPQTNPTWVYSQWLSDPHGTDTEFVQSVIDALQIQLRWLGGTGNVLIERAVLELDIVTEPTATITSPTWDQTVWGIQPVVMWTYGGDGVQKKYRVKVFTRAVAEDVDFDPETSTTVYDSGVYQTSNMMHQITSGLEYGADYYAFVIVCSDFNSTDWWGEWSTGVLFSTNSLPVVDVTAPASPVTDTNRPTIEWAYTDAESNPQTHYKIKVYEQPGGGWTGFDPETAANPLWDTGWVASSDSSVQMAVPVLNSKTYRAYVEARQSDPTLTSLWDYLQFTTSFTVPLTPTLDVVASPTTHTMAITLTPNAGVELGDVDWYAVQKSLDGGVTWDYFRGYGTAVLTDQIPETLDPVALVDHEVPLGVEVQYRAWAASIFTGQEMDSLYATDAATLTGTKCALIDPVDHTRNVVLLVEDDWLSTLRARVRSVSRPLGRALPVVVRGDGRGQTFTLQCLVFGTSAHTALILLLESDRTLYLQTPKGSWYVEVSADVTDIPHLWDDLTNEEDVWHVAIPFIEVDF